MQQLKINFVRQFSRSLSATQVLKTFYRYDLFFVCFCGGSYAVDKKHFRHSTYKGKRDSNISCAISKYFNGINSDVLNHSNVVLLMTIEYFEIFET